MPRIISVHEYSLKPGVLEGKFEQAILKAQEEGLLQLPGLKAYSFAKGIKGVHSDKYVAIWTYESREAWEELWGTPDTPLSFEQYPKNWQVWEQEILAPFLDRDPDSIEYSSYEELTINSAIR